MPVMVIQHLTATILAVPDSDIFEQEISLSFNIGRYDSILWSVQKYFINKQNIKGLEIKYIFAIRI